MHLDQKALAELECFAQGLCMDSAYHREAVQSFLAGEPLGFLWPKEGEAPAVPQKQEAPSVPREKGDVE